MAVSSSDVQMVEILFCLSLCSTGGVWSKSRAFCMSPHESTQKVHFPQNTYAMKPVTVLTSISLLDATNLPQKDNLAHIYL